MTNTPPRYSAIQRQTMFATALEAIQHGLDFGTRLQLTDQHYGAGMEKHQATFVTLKNDDLLRGCIGTLIAREALIDNIAHNAFNAAFNDPRFSPLESFELRCIKIEISLLNEPEKLEFSTEEDLLALLRPGVDGLIIREGNINATFLPAVWEQLPNAEDFLRQLKINADLDEDYWSESLIVERYTVDSFSSN